MDKDTLIKKYLHSELSAEEYAELEHLVAMDDEFASELEIQSVYYADRSSSLKKEINKYKPQKNESPIRKGIIVLLMAIVLFTVGYVVNKFYFDNQSNSHIQLAQKYLAEKHVAPTVLMGAQTDEALWTQSVNLYNEAKYKQSGMSFLQLSTSGVKVDEALLYAALSYLYGDPEQQFMAKPIFKSLIKKESIYTEEAKWYLALVSIESDDVVEAAKLLEEIVEDRSWNYVKAQKILDSMLE